MRTRPERFLALAVAVIWTVASPGPRAATVLEGRDSFVFHISGPVPEGVLSGYNNNGFTLDTQSPTAEGMVLEVHSEATELRSFTSFPIDTAELPGTVQPFLSQETHPLPSSLPPTVARITSGSRTVYDAVTSLLSWVSERIVYDSSPTAPSDCQSVLKTKRASCAGQSNLAVAMLREAGIPARIVHGLFLDIREAYRDTPFSPAMLHRWIEVYYPDAGWVYSDTLRSLNLVNARYIPFQRLPKLSELKPLSFKLLFREERTDEVDSTPFANETLYIRTNAPVRFQASVTGRIEGAPPEALSQGVVILKDSSGMERALSLEGRSDFTFAPLKQFERYRLILRCPGRSETAVNFTARPRQTQTVTLHAGPKTVKSPLLGKTL